MKTETYTSTRQWLFRKVSSDPPSGFWRVVSAPLFVLSLLYLAILKIRYFLYRVGFFPTRKLPRRVISVGNLTVGGTGKTPVVLFLTRFFQGQGKRIAILSRGYGRIKGKETVIVSDGRELLATAGESGEEAFFLARELKGVIVAVGKNRYRTGQQLLGKFPIDLFILDDGFQHIQLYRDTNILLIDQERPYGNGFLLPRGELREPVASQKRASLIFLTRKGKSGDVNSMFSFENRFDMIPAYPVRFVPECYVELQSGTKFPVDKFEKKEALLVSGIGNPASFRRLVEESGIRIVRELIFPDHHSYPDEDIAAIYDIARSRSADLIVTTDKDAVKLGSLGRTGARVMILRLKMETGADFPWNALNDGTI